jgi:glycosyltransferase involved in cell wall biosynthesis
VETSDRPDPGEESFVLGYWDGILWAKRGMCERGARIGGARYSRFGQTMRGPNRLGLAYVVNSLNPGGTERLVVEMSRAFAVDFDVRVLCLDEPGVWARELRSDGIPVYSLWRQPGLDPAMPVKLARHFREQGAQIVHAHQCTAWFYSALARLLYPAPRLLLQEHGRFYPEMENRKRAMVHRLLIAMLTHRFVAVSEDVRSRLQRYEGLEGKEIKVIYNGATSAPPLAQDARDALRRELGFTPDCFVVGTVGRFDPIKNLPMLVDTFARASKGIANLRGLLVGDGPMFPEVRSLITRAGLSDRVRTTGFREDAHKVVQCMDLFVLSSFSEGTSMALLEAIAAGVPVVVTDVGGNPEIVVKDQSGWVVPSDSVTAMTEAILESQNHPHKRHAFSVVGRTRWEEQFTFERMVDAYRQLYKDMLSAKVCAQSRNR